VTRQPGSAERQRFRTRTPFPRGPMKPPGDKKKVSGAG
jgi:hypothetical protein